MTIAWHLRGYDRRTETLGCEFDISPGMLPLVRAVLPKPENDPELIDPYVLTRDLTIRLADGIGVSIHPDRYDYFVEADEDWRLVEARRTSACVPA